MTLPERPLNTRDVGGCICPRDVDGIHVRLDCGYHTAAARQPWNHRIPWNCPTYYDGCNCEGGPYFVEDAS